MTSITTPAAADFGEAEAATDAATRRPSFTLPRLRLPSTPALLRVVMLAALVPVALFAAAVQLGVARNDATVDTVGRDATTGITVAQAIKLNLAELDELVVRHLVEPAPLAASGFPDAYDDKRAELHEYLVSAAAEYSDTAAYRQPLVNIDYVLGHYHTLVADAFTAQAAGDTAGASEAYTRAHELIDGSLLVEADFVDKANTYVLNDAYDTQAARASSTARLLVVAWAVLLAFLVIVQLVMARKFRRSINPALAVATLVALAAGGFALTRLDASSSDLTAAREESFDAIHVLARARATLVSARQSQGALLADPARAVQAAAGFDAQADRLFRVQGRNDVAGIAATGEVPDGAGGYLANVAAVDSAAVQEGAVSDALVAFGAFLEEDAELRGMATAGDREGAVAFYDQGTAFRQLADAIDEAQAIDQATFDRRVRDASDAAALVGPLGLVAAGAVLALVLIGTYQRLREYRA